MSVSAAGTKTARSWTTNGTSISTPVSVIARFGAGRACRRVGLALNVRAEGVREVVLRPGQDVDDFLEGLEHFGEQADDKVRNAKQGDDRQRLGDEVVGDEIGGSVGGCAHELRDEVDEDV